MAHSRHLLKRLASTLQQKRNSPRTGQGSPTIQALLREEIVKLNFEQLADVALWSTHQAMTAIEQIGQLMNANERLAQNLQMTSSELVSSKANCESLRTERDIALSKLEEFEQRLAAIAPKPGNGADDEQPTDSPVIGAMGSATYPHPAP